MTDQQAPPDQQQPQQPVSEGAQGYGQLQQGDPGAPPPETPEQDQQDQAIEVEARDQTGLCLTLGTEKMVKAAEGAVGRDDAQAAQHYAQAALSLAQGAVLFAPLEHTQSATTTNASVAPAPKHMPPRPSAQFGEAGMPSGPSQ